MSQQMQRRQQGTPTRTVEGAIESLRGWMGNFTKVLPQMFIRSCGGVEAAQQEMFSICYSMLYRTPKLASCDPLTLYGGIFECFSIGLRPNTPTKEAFLIPYGNIATFVLGYPGARKLLLRSGRFCHIDGQRVVEGDEYEYSEMPPKLHHKPKPDPTGKEKLRAVYGRGYLTEYLQNPDPGLILFQVTPAYYVDRIRQGAAAKKADTPWAKYPEPMERKTGLKQFAKTQPMDDVAARAFALDDSAESKERQQFAMAQQIERAIEGRLEAMTVQVPRTMPAASADPGAKPAERVAGDNTGATRAEATFEPNSQAPPPAHPDELEELEAQQRELEAQAQNDGLFDAPPQG